MRDLRKARKFGARRKRSQTCRAAAAGIAAVMVFCITCALILPAMTVETEALSCGLEEHTHTADCYRLICGKQEIFSHTHTRECYDQEDPTKLICTLTQRSLHHHSAECYPKPEPICGQQECAPHTHGESCYATQSVLICTLQEVPAHTHTDECYTDGVLTCTLQETPGHTHTGDCFREQETLICGQEGSSGHTHTEGCYPTDFHPEPICGQEDIPEHRHSQDCFSLACGKEEHVHSEQCVGSHVEIAESSEQEVSGFSQDEQTDDTQGGGDPNGITVTEEPPADTGDDSPQDTEGMQEVQNGVPGFGGGGVEVQPDIEGKQEVQTVVPAPAPAPLPVSGDYTLTKTGSWDPAAGVVHWTIMVNETGLNISGLELSDTMLSGAVTGITISPESGASCDAANQRVSFVPVGDSGENRQTYTIAYDTGGNPVFGANTQTNTAGLKEGGVTKAEGTATVSYSDGGLSKSFENQTYADGTGLLMNWKITLTVPSGGIRAGTEIVDSCDMEGGNGNHRVWMDENHAVRVLYADQTAVPGVDIRFYADRDATVPSSGGDRLMKVTFGQDIGFDAGKMPIAIIYTTKADSDGIGTVHYGGRATSGELFSQADTSYDYSIPPTVVKMDGNGETENTPIDQTQDILTWVVEAKTGRPSSRVIKLEDVLPEGVCLNTEGTDYMKIQAQEADQPETLILDSAGAFDLSKDGFRYYGTFHAETGKLTVQIEKTDGSSLPEETTFQLTYVCRLDKEFLQEKAAEGAASWSLTNTVDSWFDDTRLPPVSQTQVWQGGDFGTAADAEKTQSAIMGERVQSSANFAASLDDTGVPADYSYGITVKSAVNGEPLSGAEFGIWKAVQEEGSGQWHWERTSVSDGEETIDKYTSDSGGSFTIQKENGYEEDVLYRVVEETPPGDCILPDPVPEYRFYFSHGSPEDQPATMPLSGDALRNGAVNLSVSEGIAQVVHEPAVTSPNTASDSPAASGISVEKTWDGLGELDYTSVAFQLFRKEWEAVPDAGELQAPYGVEYGTELLPEGITLVGSYTLEKDSGWKWPGAEDLTLPSSENGKYYTYFIVEQAGSFTTTYQTRETSDGVLTLTNTTHLRPASIQVRKTWLDQQDVDITASRTGSVTFDLYQTGAGFDQTGAKTAAESDTRIGTFELSQAGGWMWDSRQEPGLADGLPAEEIKDGVRWEYTYYVVEAADDSYTTAYVSNHIQSGTISLTNKLAEVPIQTLPSTGGMGTTLFYVLGSVLTVGAAVLLVSKKRMYNAE